jgi:hypothetical protein
MRRQKGRVLAGAARNLEHQAPLRQNPSQDVKDSRPVSVGRRRELAVVFHGHQSTTKMIAPPSDITRCAGPTSSDT